ncbi:MAG: dienelactone hydrolase family protein [Halieaceae bacterium]|nr:dienelactone hydrolase family protein [Halieaceae bacterium]
MKTTLVRGVCILAMLSMAALSLFAWHYHRALWPEARSFERLTGALYPHIAVLLPEGEGPFPTALVFHGCGGLQAEDRLRAETAVARGYAAVLVDSHTPRDVDSKLNCAGRSLLGRERAADVFAALAYAREHPVIDNSKLFLVGYSHGAWSALEALSYGDTLPMALKSSPGGHLDGVLGVVAWYPYCGIAARFRKGWDADIPVLMLLAGDDEVVSPTACETVARQAADMGKAVYTERYPAVSHGFDIKLDWVQRYDEAAARRALRRQYEFMDALAGLAG